MSVFNVSGNGGIKAIAEDGCFIFDTLLIHIIRIAPYVVIIPLSLFGNLLVIYIVYKDKSMRKTINYFIINMSVADLVITVVYMPRVLTLLLWGYKWLVSGPIAVVLCKGVAFLYESAVIASILTMVIISLDRLFAVVWPLKKIITKTKCKMIMTGVWLVALVSRWPIPYAVKLETIKDDVYCFVYLDVAFSPGADMVFHKATLIVFYALPLSIISITYTAIMISLRRRKIPGCNLGTTSQALRTDQLNRQVLRMVLVVVGGFLFCWMLYFITMVLIVYKVVIPCDVFYTRLLLANCNCAINPCLYVTLSENYRRGLKRILRKKKRMRCCCKRVRDEGGMVRGISNVMELTITKSSCSDQLAYTLHINDSRNSLYP